MSFRTAIVMEKFSLGIFLMATVFPRLQNCISIVMLHLMSIDLQDTSLCKQLSFLSITEK